MTVNRSFWVHQLQISDNILHLQPPFLSLAYVFCLFSQCWFYLFISDFLTWSSILICKCNCRNFHYVGRQGKMHTIIVSTINKSSRYAPICISDNYNSVNWYSKLPISLSAICHHWHCFTPSSLVNFWLARILWLFCELDSVKDLHFHVCYSEDASG